MRDGATPWQALVAATRNGAAICGMGEQMGTIEKGKIADMIVVGGNPLDDINNVRRLQLVIKDGRIISDKRLAPTLPASRGSLPPEGARSPWGGPAANARAQ